MISSCVHEHVGSRGHVAAHALGACGSRLMKVVLRTIESLYLMTLRAEEVPFGLQSCGVRIVTVRAANSFRRHSALEKRSDLEDLFADLSVDKVQRVLRKLRPPGLQHGVE